jgi:hypothetical protein
MMVTPFGRDGIINDALRAAVPFLLLCFAGVLAAGLDFATRLVNVTHLVGTALGAALFAASGFAGALTGASASRGFGAAALGGIVYAGLTFAWIVAYLGGLARGAGPAVVAALFNVVLGTLAAYLGFTSGMRARARRGASE